MGGSGLGASEGSRPYRADPFPRNLEEPLYGRMSRRLKDQLSDLGQSGTYDRHRGQLTVMRDFHRVCTETLGGLGRLQHPLGGLANHSTCSDTDHDLGGGRRAHGASGAGRHSGMWVALDRQGAGDAFVHWRNRKKLPLE